MVPPSSTTLVSYNDYVVNYTNTSSDLWTEAKKKSVILQQTDTDAANAKKQRAKDHAGVFINTSIIRQTAELVSQTPEPATAEQETKTEGGD